MIRKQKKLRRPKRQKAAKSCENNGGCPYCERGRLHKHKRNNKPWRAEQDD